MTEENKNAIIKRANDNDGYAQFYLGWCYYYGKNGFEFSSEKADFWNNRAIKTLTLAAEQGDINAQFCLAEYYKNGIDSKIADSWFKQAIMKCEKLAKAGVVAAQVKLAECYDFGDGVSVDRNKAYFWRMRAAQLGDATAMYKLAIYFEDIDKNKSLKFCTQSANLGNVNAQYLLGHYYQNGTDLIKIDQKMAQMWFTRAAKQGDSEAAYQLKKLNSNQYVNTDEKLICKSQKVFATINKENLKTMLEEKWNELYDDYGSEAIIFIPSVNEDLKDIHFNGENCDSPNEIIDEDNSLRGFYTLSNGLTFWGAIANGDWEVPLFFIVYYDGNNLRGYVPSYGNLINLDLKTAFGSESETQINNLEQLYPESCGDGYFDFTKAYLKKYKANDLRLKDLKINWEAIKKELLTVFKNKSNTK